LDDLTDFYRERIRRYGDDPRGVGWTSRESQERRFAVIADVVQEHESVLDVGCGPGHLHDYLRARGWTGEYVGIDPMPEMVELGRAASRPVTVGDLGSFFWHDRRRFDVVVSCGVVSSQLGPEARRRRWLAGHLRAAAACAHRVVVVNFLSARFEILQPDRWFPRPGDVLDAALDVVGRVTVRHDYDENADCTVILHVPERRGRPKVRGFAGEGHRP
jgi:SAM-dependent methyltransferase